MVTGGIIGLLCGFLIIYTYGTKIIELSTSSGNVYDWTIRSGNRTLLPFTLTPIMSGFGGLFCGYAVYKLFRK